VKKWWLNFINRLNPWVCTICERESKDWEDRIKFVGRYVWANNSLYEGKTEEMYCPEHKTWMPVPQGSDEARRRFYSGESQ
jgi:hypothetical protein